MLGSFQDRCCFIGDKKVHERDLEDMIIHLKGEMTGLIKQGVTHFICGAEVGINFVAASMVIVLREEYPQITLSFVSPCEGYTDFEADEHKEFFASLGEEADEMLYLFERYVPDGAQKCERHIIDNSLYCVCYAKNHARALRAKQYALAGGKRIIDLT